MVSSNVLIALLPALVTTLAAARFSGTEPVRSVCFGGVHFLLAICVFDLSNQIVGVPEDRVNKPSRPLVTGLLTLRGAWWRLAAATVALLFSGWVLDVVHLALLWVVVAGANNHLGLAKRPFLKPLIVGVQAGIQLLSAWQVGGGEPARFVPCVIAVSALLMLLMPLQDLRDVAGDRCMGRRTLPLVYGARAMRIYLCVGFLLTPVAVRLLVEAHVLWTGGWVEAVAAVICAATAVRVVTLRSPASDDATYRLLVLWYTAMAAAPLAATF
ncbi:UbiA family prenyltransferase [Streptomyces sp. NPDC057675]|uniref:UbiA family prenyltransferase n=1 Tax=Streptomyces sp. NPDC057675 TaxID=3346204 RepID=UPI0036C0E5AE